MTRRVSVSLLLVLSLVIFAFIGLSGCTTAQPPATAPDDDTAADDPVEEYVYPTQRITFLVGYNPGGGVDSSLRQMTEVLQRELNVPIVVENEAGAGGRIAAVNIFNERPDGYNLLVRECMSVVLAELQEEVNYRALEFTPVAIYSDSGWILSAPAGSPIETFADLVAELEQREVTVGVVGKGTSGHLISSIIFDHLGLLDNVRFVFHDGGSPAMADIAGGHIDVAITGAGGFMRGREGAQAVTSLSRQRVGELPDTETILEAGYDGVFFTQIFGVLAPPGTPPEAIKILEDAFKAAYEDPAVQENFVRLGLPLDYLSSEEMGARLKEYSEVFTQYMYLVE